jgi:hypothetical protein
MNLQEIEKVIIERNVDEDILWITMRKYALFMSYGKIGIDAMALYMHYLFTSKLQKTGSIKALDTYCREGLDWGRDRMLKAKQLLADLNIAVTVIRRDEKGRILGSYVKIKAGKAPLEPIQLSENPQVDSVTSGQTDVNAYPNKLNAFPIIDESNKSDSSSHKQPLSSDDQKAVLKAVNKALSANRNDIEHVPLEEGSAAATALPEQSEGQISVAQKKEKKYTPEQIDFKKKVLKIFEEKYEKRNHFPPVFNIKDWVALDKLVKSGMSFEIFEKMAGLFYKNIMIPAPYYDHCNFTPCHFMMKLNDLGAIIGGLSESERDSIRHGTATKDIWEKVRMK